MNLGYNDVLRNFERKSIKNKVCLKYSKYDETRVNEIMKEVDMPEIDNKNEKISKSDYILFFLTQHYLETVEFKDNYQLAVKEKKVILIILIDSLLAEDDLVLNLNEFTVFNFNKPELLQESINRLKAFIKRMIYKEEHGCRNLLYLRFLSIKKDFKINMKEFNRFSHFEFVPRSELVYEAANETLDILDFNTGMLISQVKTELTFFIFFWSEFLNKIIVIPSVNMSCINVKLYSKNGTFFSDQIIDQTSYSRLRSILSNEEKKQICIHLFDYNLCSSGEIVYVFDENFTLIKKIEDYSIKELSFNYSNLVYYQIQQFRVFRCELNKQIVVLEPALSGDTRTILILDLRSYTVISSINTTRTVKGILNDKLILIDNNGLIFFFKIEFKEDSCFSQNIDSKFICKVNKLIRVPHLYVNPYLLPCGNSACVKCIYMTFNLHKNVFKCNFESCQEEHHLPQQLEPNLKLNQMMNEHSLHFINFYIEIAKSLSHNKGM